MTNPNYNSNTTGGLLQGLATLFRGIGAFNDPHKDERDRLQALLQQNPQLREQYQQQYANNPEGLKALLGKAPLVGRGNYDELSKFITGGQVSPDAIRNQQINQLQLKGTVADTSDDIANATKSVPQLSNFSKSTVQSAANSGLPMNQNEQQGLTEFNAIGRFLTPQERKIQESKVTESGNLAQRSATDLAASQFDLESAKEKKAREDTYRKTAGGVIARLGKGENLYGAYKDKKISPDEFNAIQGTPEAAKAFETSMGEYFKTLQDDRERKLHNATVKSIAEQRVGTAAEHFIDRAQLAGVPVGYDDAVKFITNPQAILGSSNPAAKPLQDALNAIRDRDKRSVILGAKADFDRQTSAIRTQLAKPGVEPSQTDIDAYNEASTNAFAGTGFAPTIYGLVEKETPGKIWGTNTQRSIGIISQDPAMVSINKGIPVISNDKAPPPKDKDHITPQDRHPSPPKQAGTNGGNGSTALPQINIDALAQDAVDNAWSDSTIRAAIQGAIKDSSQVEQVMNQIKQAKLSKKKTK